MPDIPHAQDPTPPDCFRQAEVETFQTFEDQRLATVNYYLWRANSKTSFLYAVELFFDHGETLLLSCGEDSEAIQIITPGSLVETAKKLQLLHSEAVIQRIVANIQPLWRDVVGETLQEIRLSRHESGLYQNDALLLNFGEKQILIELSEKEGLILGEY
ncbi:MAG: hypothetical protein Q7T20_04310 [Saprospiraceae bacterium]|nr:hypothetical protein [Saprospiraceae bacterium]